jgi:hypothetical protein
VAVMYVSQDNIITPTKHMLNFGSNNVHRKHIDNTLEGNEKQMVVE